MKSITADLVKVVPAVVYALIHKVLISVIATPIVTAAVAEEHLMVTYPIVK
jgi:hypothetical protein